MATTNLNLKTYNQGVDADQSFEKYRLDLAGPDNSNMTIIDSVFGLYPFLVAGLSTSLSGSVASVSGSVNNISGSISSINSSLDSIDARFIKLGEHSGSGQADFIGISGSYTHLLILGMASAGSAFGETGVVGIDFNGDSGSSNYSSVQWQNSGSYTISTVSGSETFTAVTTRGRIPIAYISGSHTQLFGNAFMAIIPNYSSSGSLYKTAFGVSSFKGEFYTTEPINTSGYLSLGTQGGYWTSTSPITRVRIFVGGSSITHYDFNTGTKISMYGLY